MMHLGFREFISQYLPDEMHVLHGSIKDDQSMLYKGTHQKTNTKPLQNDFLKDTETAPGKFERLTENKTAYHAETNRIVPSQKRTIWDSDGLH